jgi:hypothetical protein
MRKAIAVIGTFVLVLSLSCFMSVATNAQKVPKELQPPANERVLWMVHARGAQIYVCKSDGAQPAWALKGPDAQLFDDAGDPFGKHFAGPSWEANDGSRVTGKAVANAPSPDAESIPWLLLTVVSRSGKGVLSPVTSIQRINTKGGKSPAATACDVAHAGQEVRAAYSADYAFFAPK